MILASNKQHKEELGGGKQNRHIKGRQNIENLPTEEK
jgi:hypothetical protein